MSAQEEMPSYIMVNYQISLYESESVVPLGLVGVEDNKLVVYLRDFSFLASRVGELSQKILNHQSTQIVARIKSMLDRKEKPFAIYRRLAADYRWNFFVSPIAINKKPLPVIVAERVPEAELICEFEVRK